MNNFELANEVLSGHMTLEEALALTPREDDLLRILKIRRTMRLAIRSAVYLRRAAKNAKDAANADAQLRAYEAMIKGWVTALDEIAKQRGITITERQLEKTILSDVSPLIAETSKQLAKQESIFNSNLRRISDKRKIALQEFEYNIKASASFRRAAILNAVSDILNYLAEELGA